VGKGKSNDEGKTFPLDVKAGDSILFGKYSGTEIKIDGEEFSSCVRKKYSESSRRNKRILALGRMRFFAGRSRSGGAHPAQY